MKDNVWRLVGGGLLLLMLALPVWANGGSQAVGEVKAVDSVKRILTISHGPIPGLNMSAMTMDFYVADPAMLSEVQPGDKIRFEVETDRRGRYVIVDLELE